MPLTKNHQPILGVINQPVLDEFLIGDNETCELNGKSVRVRECTDLSKAVLLTTDQLNIEKYQKIEKFDKLVHQVKLYRQWGDCYGYYLVATGYADIMIDPIMSVWDMMALIPVIKGAGRHNYRLSWKGRCSWNKHHCIPVVIFINR